MIGKKRPAQLQRPANAVRLLRASLSNTTSAIIYPTKTDIGSSAVSAELTLVLNHKIWQYYENRPDMAVLYNTLWEQADQYAKENLKGNELSYYWEVTD